MRSARRAPTRGSDPLSRPTEPHPARRARAAPTPARAFKDGRPSSTPPPPRTDGLRGLKEIDTSAAQDKAAELLGELQTFWNKSQDKPAIVGLTLASFLALIAANAVAGAVDRVPIVSNFLELVGLVVTGWFAYRNLIFKPDREAFLKKVDSYLVKIFPKV